MHRRRVLAVVGGSVATLSLAGCVGGDTDDDSSDAEESADDPATLIESADETLDEFEAALDDSNDPLTGSSYAIETRPIEARLDDAEADLSAARDGATEEQLETIDALEGVVDFFRDFVAVFSALGDGMDELDTWEQYLDRERWDDAVRAAERAESHVGDAIEALIVARSTFDDVDTTALGAVDEIDRAELETDLEYVADVLDALEVLVTGSRQMAEAMLPFDDGVEALETDRFGVAASEFSAAADGFDGAHRTFTDAEDESRAEFRSDLIEFACEMDALGDASEYYALGAEAFADGDVEAGRSSFEEGEVAANRCERNDVSLAMY